GDISGAPVANVALRPLDWHECLRYTSPSPEPNGACVDKHRLASGQERRLPAHVTGRVTGSGIWQHGCDHTCQ
ncbi:MAG: hypothetical protein AAGB04_02100, partial [Pseudomonadota bacterium]